MEDRAQGPNAEQGRRSYLSLCISCHNSDPSKEGTQGPPIKGSSEALLEAKIINGQYPPNYTPKRKTQAMPKFPYLKNSVPDLAAYLRSDPLWNPEEKVEDSCQDKTCP